MDDCEVERTSERSNEGMNPEMEELIMERKCRYAWRMNDKIDANKWKNRRRKNQKYERIKQWTRKQANGQTEKQINNGHIEG